MKLLSKLSWLALLLALAGAVFPAPLRAAEPAEPSADAVEAAQAEAKPPAAADADADADDKTIDWGVKPRATGREIVRTGESATIKKGQIVPEVVVTQGSVTIDGEVTGDVVVIMGGARINGKVWGNVVNVGKGIVLGPEARIRGDAVGILGGIRMGANSVIGGSGVGIVGGITKQDGARILGEEVPIAFGQWMGPDGLPDWVLNSFYELVMKARPLSLDVGWVWVVWAIFLGVYLLLGLLFPSACELTANTFKGRALTSFLVGLLMIPLIPLVLTILAATGVGLIVVPFLLAGLFLAGLIGKAALLLHLGNVLGRQFKTQFPPLVAMVVGAVPLTLLYLVPFLGLLMLKVTDLWALGAVTIALFAGFRKERPPVPTASVTNPTPATPAFVQPMTPAPSTQALGIAPVAVTSFAAGAAALTPENSGAMPFASQGATAVEDAPREPVRPSEPTPFREPLGSAAAPAVPEALSLPRVGFRDRFLATCIDWLILGMALVFGLHRLGRFFLLLAALYFAAMWVWKQTTIGGTVLRLKVVRLDGRPIDWPTAGVRAVGALFGSLAGGLGYFWSGWDAEKQGWHDKIAGTVVVKAAKVQPLI